MEKILPETRGELYQQHETHRPEHGRRLPTKKIVDYSTDLPTREFTTHKRWLP